MQDPKNKPTREEIEDAEDLADYEARKDEEEISLATILEQNPDLGVD